MADGSQFTFTVPDKAHMLQWIEAIEMSSQLEPSTLLLHASGGVVMQTGFLDCQEFVLENAGTNPLRPQSPLSQCLGIGADCTGNYSAVDYGKHWAVLKNTGLIQCLVCGRPETLFSLLDAKRVKVHNPRGTRKDADYHISIEGEVSRIVLRAATWL